VSHAKTSVRTCIICRAKTDKYELARVVFSNGSLIWDWDQSAPGRGGYVHLKPECVSKSVNTARWERSLRLPPGVLDREQLKALEIELLRRSLELDIANT
jgi:predicted RNA-binding protein YlxR (DUF448 family)